MKVGVMQPYFLPYIGYFQLIREVDILVLTDSYKFRKRSWINRNRILRNGKISYLGLPINNASQNLSINELTISNDYSEKLRNQIYEFYHRQEFYPEIELLLENLTNHDDLNLNNYLVETIKYLSNFFNLETKFLKTSSFNLNHSRTPSEKIIEICKTLKADTYVNLPGGKLLYSKSEFLKNELKIEFIKPKIIPYPQNGTHFVPNLSIIDLLASVGKLSICNDHLPSYDLE